MWWVSPWEGRWQLEGGSAPGAHLWQVRLWWVGALEQFIDLAAMADLERYPVLPQPWHVPVSARYHRVWHQSKGIQRIQGNAPLSASQKKNVYVCNHCNFLLPFDIWKNKKEMHASPGCHRHRDSLGVNVWVLLGLVPLVVYKPLELFLLPLVAVEPQEWFCSLAVTLGPLVILYALPLITCCPVRFCSDASHHACMTVTWPQLKSVTHFLFQGTWEMFPGTL